jgi:hypothetical protein
MVVERGRPPVRCGRIGGGRRAAVAGLGRADAGRVWPDGTGRTPAVG